MKDSRGLGLKGGKQGRPALWGHMRGVVRDPVPRRLGWDCASALKVKCSRDIFKRQGPVNLKVTRTLLAASSWPA